MKTFFPLRHRLKSSISHIFASNISFHVLPLFLVARFSILSSSQACLLSLFSCKVYCLLSATKNEQRFFYSKFHIISLLDFSPTFSPLSYSEKKCVSKPKNTYYSKQFFWNNIVLIVSWKYWNSTFICISLVVYSNRRSEIYRSIPIPRILAISSNSELSALQF